MQQQRPSAPFIKFLSRFHKKRIDIEPHIQFVGLDFLGVVKRLFGGLFRLFLLFGVEVPIFVGERGLRGEGPGGRGCDDHFAVCVEFEVVGWGVFGFVFGRFFVLFV